MGEGRGEMGMRRGEIPEPMEQHPPKKKVKNKNSNSNNNNNQSSVAARGWEKAHR